MLEQNALEKDVPRQRNIGKELIASARQAVVQHDELIAVLIFVIHVYVDWYLGLAFSAQFITMGLLLVFFLIRSPERPWVRPQNLWLWIVFLLLALFPMVRGYTLRDGVYFYVNSLFNALLVFWLALLVAQDIASVRRLFKMLAIVATLLAIHTIIEARTGILLFRTARFDTTVNGPLSFPLGKTGIIRAESFMLNPDANGGFFAFMLLLPLGLFLDSSSWREKVLYLVEILLMALALLFTYTTGAWLALGAGVVAFAIFAGTIRYRVQIAAIFLVSLLAIIAIFPTQIYRLVQHATATNEWTLRFGVWQTALRVISAFPLTGIGLGRSVYFIRAQPYRVRAQNVPVYHPHNSFLEMTALGGIPLGLMFLALLMLACWYALRNWRQMDKSAHSLLGGGLAAVVSLTFFSLSNAGWTLTPLLAGGWLILGAIASPLLLQNRWGSKGAVWQEETVPIAAITAQGQNESAASRAVWQEETVPTTVVTAERKFQGRNENSAQR